MLGSLIPVVLRLVIRGREMIQRLVAGRGAARGPEVVVVVVVVVRREEVLNKVVRSKLL